MSNTRHMSRPITPARGVVWRVWLGLVVLIGAIGLDSRPAWAQVDDSGDTLTWSVRPTPTDDEPDRPNFAFDLSPGDVITDSIRVRNFDDEVLPLAIYATDAITTPSGAYDLLPGSETPTGVGRWITLDTSATLPTGHGLILVPGQGYVDVPFTLVVPANAESGDHSGGLVTSFISEGTGGAGEPVVFDHRLANRVQVRVSGPLNPVLEVDDVEVIYHGTLNPFRPGSMTVSYTVANTGNVRLGADQKIMTRGLLGITGTESTLNVMPELLPGNSLRFTVEISGVWPGFLTETRAEVTPLAVRPGDVIDSDPVSGITTTWTIPWSHLVIVLLLVGVILIVVMIRRARRRRLAGLTETEALIEVRVQEAVDAALAARGLKPDPTDEEPENNETTE